MISRRSFIAAAGTIGAALSAASARAAARPSHATRVLCENFFFGDGARWREGRLWFSDFFAHAVKSVSLAGDLRTEFEIDDQPSGLGWMPDGSLLIVSMLKRQLLRRWPDGKIGVHADLSNIAIYSCNDLVVDARGRAYVGDFGFELFKEFAARGFESVVADHPTAMLACVAPDGSARVVARDLHFPNGSVITPNGKTLIVAETLAERLAAFDIEADGSLTNRRVWAQVSPRSPHNSARAAVKSPPAVAHRLPDGIGLNADGHVWIANAGGPECVLFAPGGKIIDVIHTDLPCFSCILGGDDGRTLFMLTAPTSDPAVAIKSPKAKLITTTVRVPHAGLP